MIHRQDTGDTHTHKHQRFGSGVYFKIRPIQLVQQIENLYKLQVYFDLVFNSMHCNIQFLPIPLGFTILKCLHSAQLSRNRVAPGRGATQHAGALPRGGDNDNGFANSSPPLLQRCDLSSYPPDGVNHLPRLPH